MAQSIITLKSALSLPSPVLVIIGLEVTLPLPTRRLGVGGESRHMHTRPLLKILHGNKCQIM